MSSVNYNSLVLRAEGGVTGGYGCVNRGVDTSRAGIARIYCASIVVIARDVGVDTSGSSGTRISSAIASVVTSNGSEDALSSSRVA